MPGVPPGQAAGVTSAVVSNLMGFPTGAAAFRVSAVRAQGPLRRDSFLYP